MNKEIKVKRGYLMRCFTKRNYWRKSGEYARFLIVALGFGFLIIWLVELITNEFSINKDFRVVLGYGVSTMSGDSILWIFQDHLFRPYQVYTRGVLPKKPGSLSCPLGILERFFYTAALHSGYENIIAVWFAMKIAAQFQTRGSEDRQLASNLFLVGNLFSLLFGVIGWCIIRENWLLFMDP